MTAKPDPANSRKRIHDDHQEIASLLAQCTASEDASQVQECMQRLEALLERHFKAEEGELDRLRTTSPRPARLESNLKGLREEHRQLLESVRAVIERAGKARGDDASLREMSKALRDRFSAHESRETDIFVESIWSDIGKGD